MGDRMRRASSAGVGGRLTRRRFLAAAGLGVSSVAAWGLLGFPRPVPAAAPVTPLGRRAIPFEPYLRVGAAAGGYFSPDGRRLTFRSDAGGVPQVWELDLEAGHARQRISHAERVT